MFPKYTRHNHRIKARGLKQRIDKSESKYNSTRTVVLMSKTKENSKFFMSQKRVFYEYIRKKQRRNINIYSCYT